MALLGENLDYTDKDFDSLRTRLFNLIASVFPTWTSRQIANFGNLLVEMYAFVGDVLCKYQDNQAIESRWSKANQRKNLIALAKLIGYEPATATAAQVDVTISISAATGANVSFPAGTVVRTRSISNPVEFRLLSDAIIPAGSTSVSDITAENSESQSDIFTSTGVPNISFQLPSTPYIDNSAIISAGNGVYTEVDNFLDSDSTDLHFTVVVDQNDKALIRFGDGINGVIPVGTITVVYKTGGGTSGIVEASSVTVIEGNFRDDNGVVVQASVTNPNASTTAIDRQTVAQIKELAPLSLRVLNRTVSREDYELNARRVTGVSRALMLTSNEETAIQENNGFLFIIPTGGGQPTQDLKDQVLEMVTVTYPNTLTFNLTVSGASFKTVDVYARIRLATGQNATTVKSRIETNLQNFFAIEDSDGIANEAMGFGYDFKEDESDNVGQLPLSDVFNVVRDTEGVRKIIASVSSFTLNGEYSDVELLLREFPQLGTVTLINDETGAAL